MVFFTGTDYMFLKLQGKEQSANITILNIKELFLHNWPIEISSSCINIHCIIMSDRFRNVKGTDIISKLIFYQR